VIKAQKSMEISINLNSQGHNKWSKKSLKVYAIVALGLSLATAVLLFYDLKSSSVLLWFYTFYFLMISFSLYMQSKGKHLLDLLGESYFNLDDTGFACKLDLFRKKVVQYQWTDIEDIEVKLFEVQVQVKGHWESINLEKLSDENLKIIKSIFSDFQSKFEEKQAAVA